MKYFFDIRNVMTKNSLDDYSSSSLCLPVPVRVASLPKALPVITILDYPLWLVKMDCKFVTSINFWRISKIVEQKLIEPLQFILSQNMKLRLQAAVAQP